LHFALFRYRPANEHLGLDQSCFLQTIVHDNKGRRKTYLSILVEVSSAVERY